MRIFLGANPSGSVSHAVVTLVNREPAELPYRKYFRKIVQILSCEEAIVSKKLKSMGCTGKDNDT